MYSDCITTTNIIIIIMVAIIIFVGISITISIVIIVIIVITDFFIINICNEHASVRALQVIIFLSS